MQLEKMVPESAKTAQPKAQKAIKRAGEAVDTVEYYVVSQSTTSNYAFMPNGGDILPHNAGIAIEGSKVTFHNLFGLYHYRAHFYGFCQCYHCGLYFQLLCRYARLW